VTVASTGMEKPVRRSGSFRIYYNGLGLCHKCMISMSHFMVVPWHQSFVVWRFVVQRVLLCDRVSSCGGAHCVVGFCCKEVSSCKGGSSCKGVSLCGGVTSCGGVSSCGGVHHWKGFVVQRGFVLQWDFAMLRGFARGSVMQRSFVMWRGSFYVLSLQYCGSMFLSFSWQGHQEDYYDGMRDLCGYCSVKRSFGASTPKIGGSKGSVLGHFAS